VTDAEGKGQRPDAAPADTAVERFCTAIDRMNEWVGRLWGALILVVTVVVIYEVVARTFFGKATIWANETTIYLSAMVYLLGGGYGLKHRRHVRIDVLYQLFSAAAQRRLDILAFVFFFGYVGALVWVGAEMAWASFQLREGTGTPWDPAIWPVKAAIPIAGVLLLLQGIVNLLREMRIGGASAWPQ
jgi:TRAP-type mannitol/chloroaromatic compound transport system permease small subunit